MKIRVPQRHEESWGNNSTVIRFGRLPVPITFKKKKEQELNIL
jgi:hypothetical protein